MKTPGGLLRSGRRHLANGRIKAERALRSRAFDYDALADEEARKFERLGLDEAEARALLDGALAKLGRRPFDSREDSIHWLLFAALVQVTDQPEILEIGTYDGRFTALLHVLFPESRIVTVELPAHDPVFRASYRRGDPGRREDLEQSLASSIADDRITSLRCNSFFLLDELEGLDTSNVGFDLLWIDGGHLYPAIAWDIAYAFHLCRPGGFIGVDDILFHPSAGKFEMTGLATAESLQYAIERTAADVTYLLKRRNDTAAVPRLRKYVGVARPQ